MPALSLPDAALGPAGAVIASLVAASVAFASLIISKEQKTSEFRQAWIDALRADAATTVARLIAYSEAQIYGGARGPDSAVRRAEALALYMTSEATVRLRLNPAEDRCVTAFECLDHMNDLVARGDLATTKTTAAAAKFVAAIQPILKAEWTRVKRGEFWFRVTKLGSLIAIAAAVALLVLIYQGASSSPPRPAPVAHAAK